MTGAFSGLGRATAIKLSQLDAKVCLIDRDNLGIEETLPLMKEDNHLAVSVDLCSFEEYDIFFKNIISK